ncbi:MAG TPA: radical SAM protein [Candidatus Bathyarchaeota archaeon]|nr:radical SAM protein [Candidatus Bathyarchaeota archaeon]
MSAEMMIKGFIELSHVDWDRAAAVLFLPGCNFRCPFCQNVDLVLHPEKLRTIPMEELEASLRSAIIAPMQVYTQVYQDILPNIPAPSMKEGRLGISGVVITGGEPTIHKDLPELCAWLKEMGFPVKLDTNGTNPKMLEKLIGEGLVDYIAMDVKAPLDIQHYSRATNADAERFLPLVRQSIGLIMETGIPHEFRTTLVPTIHSRGDVKRICQELRGCMSYVLQSFRPGETIDPKFSDLKPFTVEELNAFLQEARSVIPHAYLRI